MSESIPIITQTTEDLDAATRRAIIDGCIAAHQEEDFQHISLPIFPPLAGRKETELLPTPGQADIMISRLARTPSLNLEGGLTIEYDGRIW